MKIKIRDTQSDLIVNHSSSSSSLSSLSSVSSSSSSSSSSKSSSSSSSSFGIISPTLPSYFGLKCYFRLFTYSTDILAINLPRVVQGCHFALLKLSNSSEYLIFTSSGSFASVKSTSYI